jgi:hypothetical protein
VRVGVCVGVCVGGVCWCVCWCVCCVEMDEEQSKVVLDVMLLYC